MTKKDFDYMQLQGVVDSRPFIVPGLLGWMRATSDPVHVKFIYDFPGVEGVQGIPHQTEEYPVLVVKDDKLMSTAYQCKTLVLNFADSACKNFFISDQGIGCMMRFNGQARSVFVPFTAMLLAFCPAGVKLGELFGYGTMAQTLLIGAITPGMYEALTGSAQPGEKVGAAAEQETPAPAPKSQPSFLKRVK